MFIQLAMNTKVIVPPGTQSQFLSEPVECKCLFEILVFGFPVLEVDDSSYSAKRKET